MSMRRLRLIALGVIVLLVSAACASTFLITKEGRSYYFGSKEEGIYKMLCASGDLQKILAATTLPDDRKADLYKYNCTEPSLDKMKETLGKLSREQRRELRLSFQRHGYDINVIHC